MSARSIRNAVAAVVLTAAVAAAGTACGGGGTPDDDGRTPKARAAEAPSPTAEDGNRTAAPGKSPAKKDDPAGDGPTVPRAELTPATGSFTKKQKEYLVDRVPRGMDPAAVLEAGRSVCDRIARTAEVDREAAISALRSGEISGAEDAVGHLCPKYQPLLEAAGLTGG